MTRKEGSLSRVRVGSSLAVQLCEEAKGKYSNGNLDFQCLEARHFEPNIVATYPYEDLSHAVVSWVLEHQGSCELIHGHEWGGILVDVVSIPANIETPTSHAPAGDLASDCLYDCLCAEGPQVEAIVVIVTSGLPRSLSTTTASCREARGLL